VDDTLIVLPAHPRQLHCLKEILDIFATATRLHINFHKNTFVPIHVEADDAAELTAILGYPVAGFPQSYLGLPLSNGKISASVLDLLAVKVARSFPGQRTSLLTSADRLTLASAVLTAQSLYAMAALSLPATTLQRIDRPGKGLFWKGVLKYFGGDCLVACRDVEDSGVGLKDLATLNSALLLKHLHKLFSRESNSWTDWVRLWYDNGFAEDHTPCRRALKALIPQYRAVTMVVLDDGQMDSFWHDAWVEAGACWWMSSPPSTLTVSTQTQPWWRSSVSVASRPTHSNLVSPPPLGTSWPSWNKLSLTSCSGNGPMLVVWLPSRRLSAPPLSMPPSAAPLVGRPCQRSTGTASPPRRESLPSSSAFLPQVPDFWHSGQRVTLGEFGLSHSVFWTL
jgi:hypothetical protein